MTDAEGATATLASFLEETSSHAPLLSTIFVALPVVLGLFKTALSGPNWRRRVRIWLYGGHWSRAYAGLLDGLLGRLDAFFGPAMGRKAFERCLQMAALYAVCVTFLQAALQEANGAASPLVLIAGFAVFYFASFFLTRWIAQRHAAARAKRRRATRALMRVTECLALAATAAILSLAGIVASEAAGVFPAGSGGASAFAVEGVGASAFAVAAAGAVSGAGVLAGVGAIVIAVAFAFVYGGAGEGAGALVLGLLLGMPLLNAAFDWPSWAASRWLMRRLREDAHGSAPWRNAAALLLHVGLDLSLALVCLFALTGTLALGLMAINATDLWYGLATAAHTPFSGYGLAMTVMLLSTLVPTIIHLFFAVFALATLHPPFASRTAFWLQEDQDGEEPGTQWLVALYLTGCAGFAALVLWAAGRLALHALDGLVGGAGIWPWIFTAAERAVPF